jgi:hypothetical protein
MSAETGKKIGLIIGDEQEWTEAFLQGVNASEKMFRRNWLNLAAHSWMKSARTMSSWTGCPMKSPITMRF